MKKDKKLIKKKIKKSHDPESCYGNQVQIFLTLVTVVTSQSS